MKVKHYIASLGSKTSPIEKGYLILINRRYQHHNGSGSWMEFDYCLENMFDGINYRINDLFSIQKESCSDGSPNYSTVFFIKLSPFQLFRLKWMFGRHLLQKNKFWMWLVNICIAVLAVVMSYLNLHQSAKTERMEVELKNKEKELSNKESQIIQLNDILKNHNSHIAKDTIK